MRIGSRSVDRYVMVGLFNTALDFVLFSFLALAVALAPLVANAISTVIVMTISFFINRAWVFRSEQRGLLSYARFAGVTLFTGLLVQSAVITGVLAVTDAVVPALAEETAKPGAKLTAMAVGMIVNFLGYRWLFASKGREQSPPETEPAAGRRSPSA